MGSAINLSRADAFAFDEEQVVLATLHGDRCEVYLKHFQIPLRIQGPEAVVWYKKIDDARREVATASDPMRKVHAAKRKLARLQNRTIR
jgi:hypothetical protein